MRMFVAALPPAEALEDLDEFLAARRDAAPFRWTSAEQWHLTLAFAGNVPDRAYDEMVDRLAAAAARRRPVGTRIAGGGAFPTVDRAKVLFAGVQTGQETGLETGAQTGHETGLGELGPLATGARNAMGTAGVEVDGRRFRPHLTLARLQRPVEASSWVRVLETYRGPPWTIEEIVLVASHLGEGSRHGPRHETLETFSLGPAGSGPAPPDARGRGR